MEILMVGLLVGILVVLVMILERLRVIEKYWAIEKKEKYVSFDEDLDELFPEALKVILVQDRVSASLLQRKLSIGYARAARLLDQLRLEGLVSETTGAKPREVYKDRIDEYLREN